MDTKEGWRYASRVSGDQSVRIAGTIMTLRWPAGNWSLEQ